MAAKDQVAALQAAQAELHEERGRLQAELAAARQQAAAAQQAQQETEQQRAAVQERLALAESALGDSRQLAAKAQEQHAEAAASTAEMRQQVAEAQQAVADAQQRLAAAAGEKQEWSQQRSELQEQVAALQKAQAVADGKLVVARQREAQFKVHMGASRLCRVPKKFFVMWWALLLRWRDGRRYLAACRSFTIPPMNCHCRRHPSSSRCCSRSCRPLYLRAKRSGRSWRRLRRGACLAAAAMVCGGAGYPETASVSGERQRLSAGVHAASPHGCRLPPSNCNPQM